MRDRNGFYLLVTIVLFGNICLYITLSNAAGSGTATGVTPSQSGSTDTPTFVNVSISPIEIFVYYSGQVQLNVVADAAGDLNVVLTSDGTGFPSSWGESVSFGAGPTTVTVPITPNTNALPGTYTIHVLLQYVNVSQNNVLSTVFSCDLIVHVGLGFIIGLFLLVGIFSVAIIYAVKRGSMPTPVGTPSPAPQITASNAAGTTGTPSHKIHCPECKKIIAEGSVFCPECGYRIPEFLRYNANPAESA